MTHSRTLTIFEGCDGGGKSTTAKLYAEATGARYVHFPALPRINSSLARLYVEAMLPALLGYQDVVFDRCWLSEKPYGVVFRDGWDRLGDPTVRMLERLALRCSAVVVWCDPGFEAIEQSYQRRKGQEMLRDTSQLRAVYDIYNVSQTQLTNIDFNYLIEDRSVLFGALEMLRHDAPRHPLDTASAGRWSAKIALVGDMFAERKDSDSFYQWPFASFNRMGCSQWLAKQLQTADVHERDLVWVNSDQPMRRFIENHPTSKIVALGGTAATVLAKMGVEHEAVEHPQAWKRFHSSNPYPLIKLLKEMA